MSRVGTDHTSAHGGGQAEFEPASMPFREGDLIGAKYEVIQMLGSGATTFVVAARHIELDETVALKFLRPEYATHAELVARFDREARASLKIESEHVARIIDVGAMPDGAPFM